MEDVIRKRKAFQLIKTFVCALCFHLLTVVGCIKQTSKTFKITHF